MFDPRQQTTFHAQVRALHQALQDQTGKHPVSSSLTALMRHGGLYTLLDTDLMSARLSALSTRTNGAGNFADMAPDLHAATASFFTRLVANAPYQIPSSLMSHIVLPHEGAVYTKDSEEKANPQHFESPKIPAVFTFIGQFIDHDLTMNAVNLFEPQQDPIPALPGSGLADKPSPIADGASPLIDLDSVYGPRTALSAPFDALYEGDKFKLVTSGGITDLPRTSDGGATIADKRNDENQMILQIHLLVQRLHNKFVESGKTFEEARELTILNWQHMILNDYLPRIIQAETLHCVLTEIHKPAFGKLKHKPSLDLASGKLKVSMPHEFAIAFRFGHSQLRRGYLLNASHPKGTVLFDNSLVGGGASGAEFDDLRGGQTLRAKNAIDWHVFYPRVSPVLSNRIDGKVTARVFDLPESAIPDDIKYIGNLPHRNLIRSRQIGLCSGEALAEFYCIKPLTPVQVEPNPAKHALYMGNEARKPGDERLFETPLWYYILREAETFNAAGPNEAKLGPLGSRLVAEVIVGAIAYAETSVLRHPDFKSTIPGPDNDHLRNIIRFVNDLTDF